MNIKYIPDSILNMLIFIIRLILGLTIMYVAFYDQL